MGTYNVFTMDVTVPAGAVAPLAAELRKFMGDNWYPEDDIKKSSDADLVAWALFTAEGGSDDYGSGPGPEFTDAIQASRPDGSVVVESGGYGKLSFKGDEIEGLYAKHGATGAIECELDDGMNGRYVIVFRDGGREYYEATIVYPQTEAQEVALRRFALFLTSGKDAIPSELIDAMAAVAAEERGVE